MSSSLHSHKVHTPRRSSSALSNARSDSSVSLPSRTSKDNHHHGGHGGKTPQGAGKESGRRNQSQKHLRQTNGGKQNNSNQRSMQAGQSDDEVDGTAPLATPTKKPGRSRKQQAKQQPAKMVVLLTRDAPESEQQALLAKLAPSGSAPATTASSNGGRAARRRSKNRRQATPPRVDDTVALVSSYSVPSQPTQQQPRTPMRRGGNNNGAAGGSRQKSGSAGGNLSTIYSPTPRMGQALGAPGGGGRMGSPSNGRSSNHYAGASFNNSPAPNTLPLPPVFLTSPTAVSPTAASAPAMLQRDEDVFDVGKQQQRQNAPVFPLPSGSNAFYRQPDNMMFGGSPHRHMYSPPPAQAAAAAAAQHAPLMMLGQLGSQSAVDLTQTGTDVAGMFQKLRLIKEMSQQRAATVSPVSGTSGNMAATVSFPQQTQQQLTPVYNA
ncbi:hypothetical protein GGI15_003991 [Coemansia interrupta]|uniref:Uncharacterized protein n=1 Tax=Coemansia interrupta TaxID=1126814 RepID=A0A9W8H6R0_9FUNG|nr:hypothetical protein GGI15_003991 [Coemansia interrupta]